MHHDPAPPDHHARHHDSRQTSDRTEDLTRCAETAEDAIRQLARLTIDRPSMNPADIDDVLSHLAETVAALPQVAAQLGSILDQTRQTHDLVMDGMTATTDPDLAIDTARHHLDQVRAAAVRTYRHLNAARNEAAHISATPRDAEFDDSSAPEHGVRPRHPEDHQSPSAAGPIRRRPAR